MATNPNEPDFEETMRQARERLERMRSSQQQVIEPEQDAGFDVPALQGTTPVPETDIDASTGAVSTRPVPEQPDPSPEQRALPPIEGPAADMTAALAQAKSRLSETQESLGLKREDDKSWFTDAKTTGKIALLYPFAGKFNRGETEMGLRELTKNLVWEQLPEEDQKAVEALRGKPIHDMKWNELERSMERHYGADKTPLRAMMGFREGDEDKASGAPAFPMAYELIAGSLKSGSMNFYESFIRPIFSDDTPELSERLVAAVEEASKSYSLGSQESVDKTMVAEDAVWYNPFTYFDEDTKDPYHDFTGFMHTMGQQSGNIVAMIIAARLGGRGGASLYTRSMTMTKPGKVLQDIQKYQRTGARIGGGAAGGKAEMSLIRDGVFSEVNQRILNDLPDEVWSNHEPYKRLIDAGMTSEEAKQVIAYSHANNAGDTAMIISGAALGTPMGVLYGSRAGVSAGRAAAKDSIYKQMGKGAALETGQEMSQELVEQVSGNLSVRKIDPNQDLWEGGLEAVMTAFFISAGPGAVGGIHGQSGAGISAETDQLIRQSQPWVNAANERWKHQNKVGPNTAFAKDASPQDQLTAMIELERLQKKEAEEFTKIRAPLRALMEKSGVSRDSLIEFDAKSAGYETDLAMIAKQRARRMNSKKQARQQAQADRERQDARSQIERDVMTINDNMTLVDDMMAVKRGEPLPQIAYDRLQKQGYGTYTGKDDRNFALTKRGTRAMEELSRQAGDLRSKIESGYQGGERREDAALRESMSAMSDEEFEAHVMRDPTTNLWNKRKWDQDVGKAKAVAVLDADSLKWVNDNMSHSAGTEYLQKISRELESLGGGIESYRYGGDEFIVTANDSEALQQAVERAMARISQISRVEEGGQSVKVTVSVGYGQDFDSADASLNQEKTRRLESGERMDARSEGAVPPSFLTVSEAKSPQMSLFAMAGNYNQFDDINMNSTNLYGEEYWDEYVRASERAYTKKFTGVTEVEAEQMEWIHEVADEFLPSSNSNNPPITIVHDAEWLRILSPNQYKELTDIPFGASHVRGMFSMDDPSHGIFIMADVIVNEAKAKLRYGNRITTWAGARYRIKEGDQVELINNETQEVDEVATIEEIKTTSPVLRKTPPKELRAVAAIIKQRKKLTRLEKKEDRLIKQLKRMSKPKRRDRSHPVNVQLSALLDDIGIAHLDLNKMQADLSLQRNRTYGGWSPPNLKNDEIIVRRKNGDLLSFDPNENAILDVKRGAEPATKEEKNRNDVIMGQFRGKSEVQQGWSTIWHSNLGNVEASLDEELTKEMVQEIAADTIMHETVGHFGVRGITKDWDKYIELTHALVDAFPEVVSSLRMMGYNYRDDINRGDKLNDQNKALLGEEVMAWVAGNELGRLEMAGMTLPQQTAVQRFMAWFKQQLLNLGFNKYYRSRKAASIRSLRRKIQTSKGAKRLEYQTKLDELIFIGPSGVRLGIKWRGGKKQRPGVVVKSKTGFLNDDDLLSIIARAHDFVRNGKNKFKFTDHDGNHHLLPMRDVNIFRKPIYHVMAEGTRSRIEEEVLTEEDLVEGAAPPTLAEAYEKVTETAMPADWKLVRIGDFKDRAKELQKEGVQTNPKKLFEEAVPEDQQNLMKQVSSIIEQGKKETERRAKIIKSKKAKIEQLEKRWGKDAVRNDQIPIFPDVATIDGFIDALRNALPSASGPGYITPTEVEASGILGALMPSRINLLIQGIIGEGSKESFSEQTGISVERIEALRKSMDSRSLTVGTQAEQATNNIPTKEEAVAIVQYMEQTNSNDESMGMPHSFADAWLDTNLIKTNNALSVSNFVDIMGQYGLSQQSPNLATLMILFGEDHQLTKDYVKAKAMQQSGDPDEVIEGSRIIIETMGAPVDPANVQVTKEWVMDRINTPVYDVSVSEPVHEPDTLANHYERITGEVLPGGIYEAGAITDEVVRKKVHRAIKRDRIEGPDVGFDTTLNKWIAATTDSTTASEWSSLMPVYVTGGSHYKAAVFWQNPAGSARIEHFGYSEFRGEDQPYDSGAFAHTRYDEANDGDPNAPTAPNPEKQGKSMLNFEHQSDWAQTGSKSYSSAEEEEAATLQHKLDGMALQQSYQTFANGMADMMLDLYEKEVADTLHGADLTTRLQEDYEAYVDDFTGEDEEIAKELIAINIIAGQSTGSLELMRGAMSTIKGELKEEASPLKWAAQGHQPSAEGVTAPVKITFIGDARLFSWMDSRAMAAIFRRQEEIPSSIETMQNTYRFAEPGSSEWDTLKENGGLMKLMRLATQQTKGPYAKAIRRVITSGVRRLAALDQNNMPGHRLPFMRAKAEESLRKFADQIGWTPKDNSNSDEAISKLLDRANEQKLLRMNINYVDMADITSTRSMEVLRAINSWADTSPTIRTPKIRNESDGTVTIELVGSAATIDEMRDQLTDSLKEYMAVKLNEGSLEATRSSLRDKEERITRSWYQGRANIANWMEEFNIQEAAVRITQNADSPFQIRSEEMANGLDVEKSLEALTNHELETFDKYVKRMWTRHWGRQDAETRAELVRLGGSEDTATPQTLERYANAWNDAPPKIVMARLPVSWDDESNPTDFVNMYLKREKVGGSLNLFFDGEQLQSDVDWWSYENNFSTFVRDYYDAKRITVDSSNFKNTKRDLDKLVKEVADLQTKVDEGVDEVAGNVKEMFSHESLLPTYTDGMFDSLEKSFRRTIDYYKKSGYQQQYLIEKNEQWRVMTMLWSLSEAVRNGYARMHMPYGSASGARGGFLFRESSSYTYWHHADSIDYTLEKQEVRGQMRDILVVKADKVMEPMWIDVTEDKLVSLNPDRIIQDNQTDPLEGFFSGTVAKQLGRDVAEVIGNKLKSSKDAPQNDRLLISSFASNWLVHDTSGNILGTLSTKKKAEEFRDFLGVKEENKQEAAGKVISGSVNKADMGGPIMFMHTQYAGYPKYHFDDPVAYQHTVAPPTMEGGRSNYDIMLLSRLRGHIKQFGLDIEEGTVNVPTGKMSHAVMAEGGRRVITLSEEMANRYPNIRIDEVSGENYGFIINSDNGVVLQSVYGTSEEAASAYGEWVEDHSIPDDGRVKVYQVTFNQALIDYHSQPVNPYLNVSYAVKQNEHLQAALDKIGSNEPKLLDRFNSWRKSWKASANIGMFDRFYGILHALKVTGQAGMEAEFNAYIQARMTTGLDSIMRGIMEFGYPVRRDGVIENEGKGLLKVLEPVADQIELWAAYMAGVRAKRLLSEGRERLFTNEQIDAMVELGETFPLYKEVAADYAHFNKKLLDFAEEAGIIDAETRPLWENADYIPFYRIVDDRLVGALQKGVGIANQNSPIKTLKGGTNNVGDLIHNIMMNATNLMDASIKNHAAILAIDALEPTGMIQKQKGAWSKELIPMSNVAKILQQNGMDISTMPDEVTKGLRVMFAMQAPKGDGIISILRNGKKEFYHTDDELLFRSLSSLNMKAFGAWMNLLRAPKRLLTTFVTLDPGFMIANFVRDSMSAFVLSRDHFVPMISGLKGFATAITEGDTMKAMISSGAAFDSGYINQGDPKATARMIKRTMKDAGFQRTLLNTPRKLFEAWKRIGSASENANRIAVYEAAIKAGKSKAQASYESKDLMDFSMGGDWPFIQFLIQSVPFMGARMQGLQRLGRGAAEHPVAFALKGSMIGMAGMALWLAFRDDERYKELEDWDKDVYFHWWIGDQHYRLPKGFEVGAIFNTIPERIFEYMYSQENDAGKYLMRRFGFMIAETFNMNPVPQAARPLAESLANYSFFRGRSIETPWEEERLPEDRYRYYTSPTMIELADALPDALNTVLNGKIKSPLHLQNIYAGYTGTLGRYFLMAADEMLRMTGDYDIPPERTIADWPVIGRFYRGDAPRRTRYEEEFYRELRTVIQLTNSMALAEKEGDDPRFDELEEKYAPYLERAQEYKGYRSQISRLNKEIREAYQDDTMTAKEKRAEINEIQLEKNAIFKDAYDDRPSAASEDEGDMNINTLMDNFDTTSPDGNSALKAQAPMTASLFDGVHGMSKSQLESLAKTSNSQVGS